MRTLCSASAASLRDSHVVYVKPTNRRLGSEQSKAKRARVFTSALFMVGIIGFVSHEQALSAQIQSLPPATAVPCPLFVPTSFAATTQPVLPVTTESTSSNPAEELSENQPVSEPINLNALTVAELAPTLYLISREENIAVFVDGNDVLLIGSAGGGQRGELRTCIARVTELPVKYIIATHQHDRQPNNINTLSDPDTVIIAHENTRARMITSGLYADGAAGLPTTTFMDRYSLLDDLDRIELYHFGPAHTDGDIVVVFPQKGVAYLGDLFAGKGIPVIDIESGGSGLAFPETLARALDTLTALEVEYIVPGKAAPFMGSQVRLMSLKDLQEYVDFNRDFLAATKVAFQAGQDVDEAAASLTLPNFPDYDMEHTRANIQAIYDELQ